MLFRNSLWNGIGLVAPLAAGLLAIPHLIGSLGGERFGYLTLAWSLIGYFSLFDLGLGRAITKSLSEQLEAGDTKEISSTIWSGLFILVALGLAASLVLTFLAETAPSMFSRVPEILRIEVKNSFVLVAWTVPLVTLASGLRGILESKQEFFVLTLFRVGFGILTFIGPMATAHFSVSLVWAISTLTLSRLLMVLVSMWYVFRVLPSAGTMELSARKALTLLRLGGWMTVSNIVSPIMVYFDRFLITGIISASAAGYYGTGQEVVTKLLLIPSAVAGVMFPALCAAHLTNQARLRKLYEAGIATIVLGMLPVFILLLAFGREGTASWLGNAYGHDTWGVMRFFLIAIVPNGAAMMAFALIQAGGRPDITAKIHLIEFPFYAAAAWFAARRYGVDGAAIVWTCRSLLDSLLLLTIAQRWTRCRLPPYRKIAEYGLVMFLAGITALSPSGLYLKILAIGILFTPLCKWLYRDVSTLMGVLDRDG